MTKIAFIDASAQDKAFFEEKLSDHELEFVTSDRWRTINPQVEVLSVFVDFNVTRDIIDVLPDLKMITCRSSGYNNIDLVAAKERGIIVANTPGYGASSVAEYAMT
ncbi:MAG: hydroxyacid dehydrogenase, partial [Candidatus Nomurabacteria bacterium]|nr:hydroxyacid dehydrogenase [Candidatus Nomurabacteria bacterium]